MGAVNFSIDRNLAELLKEQLGLRVFVETGTFEGETVEAIRDLFDQVLSVEISDEYFRRARKRFFGARHVKISQGDSADFLRRQARKLSSQATLYWLDAHWCCADNTGGQDSQCPLLEELQAIEQLSADSIIMIDDARLFLCTPCAPHKVSQWPSLQEVLDGLCKLSATHRTMVLNDVILFHPRRISDLLDQYAHENGVDWLHTVNRARRADTLEQEAREERAVRDYFMKRALEMPNDMEALWEQLVEKEAVIQGLIKDLRDAKLA